MTWVNYDQKEAKVQNGAARTTSRMVNKANEVGLGYTGTAGNTPSFPTKAQTNPQSSPQSGADHKRMRSQEVDPDNRNVTVSDPYEITPGSARLSWRGETYSAMKYPLVFISVH